MPMQAIIPPGSGKPLAPYSPGAMADGVVYVSGTLSFDKDNNVIHVGDPGAQTRHVLDTIKGVIEAAGGSAIATQAHVRDPGAVLFSLTELAFGGSFDQHIAATGKKCSIALERRPREPVAFRAGPDAGWINGQTLRANGGIVCRRMRIFDT